MLAKGTRWGVWATIFKPFAPEVLKSKVAAFVEMYKQRREVQEQSAQLKARARFRIGRSRYRQQAYVIVLDLDTGSCGSTGRGRQGRATPGRSPRCPSAGILRGSGRALSDVFEMAAVCG